MPYAYKREALEKNLIEYHVDGYIALKLTYSAKITLHSDRVSETPA